MTAEDAPSHFPSLDATTRPCTGPEVDFDLVSRDSVCGTFKASGSLGSV